MSSAPPRRELPPLPYSWREVRERLQGRQWMVYDRLGLKGPHGNELFTPLNPTRADRHPGSFVIHTDQGREGGWTEYGAPGTPSGDIIDLVVYCLRLKGRIDAYWWALDFLGLPREGHGGRVRREAESDTEKKAREQAALDHARAEEKARDAKAAKAFSWWRRGAPLAGSIAETYLKFGRKIPLERLRHPPGALRFLPADERVDRETGEVTETPPALFSAMTAWDRGVRAVHITSLEPDGRDRLRGDKAKKMWGDARGCAIRVSKGKSGLTPEMAAKKGITNEVLVLGEGIETALSAAVAMPDWRSWAAGSLSLLAMLEWPPCVGHVVLLGENDGGAAAREAFAAAEARWRARAEGRVLTVLRPPAGCSDLNDWLMGRGG